MNNKENNNHFDPKEWMSAIPKHLTPDERKQWMKDLEWEKKEKERRRRDGLYGSQRKRGRPRKTGGQEFSFIS
jgi:hypothetical protein